MALAELFAGEAELRSSFAGAPVAGSGKKTEAALSELYSRLDYSPPWVIWCQSLYQLVTLPSLLIGLLHGDMWQVLSLSLTSFPFSEQEWQQFFDEAWAELWEHGGCQLLAGMKRTSRIGSQCADLETPLIRQAKQEMAAWLKSGQMSRFEDKLNRQLYRRFWAKHSWQKNFVRERMLVLTSELDYELSRCGQHRLKEWEQFSPYAERIRALYGGVAASLNATIMRMGAEPAAQARNALWLPFSFPAASLCAAWQEHVNPASFLSYSEEMALWNCLSDSILGAICLEDVAFVCQKPTAFTFDEGGRLHNQSGPALCFADGFVAHAWHGVEVERRVIEEPDSITIEEIDQTANIEQRRVLLERYGQSRYLQESCAEIIDQDDFGVLYRKDMGSDEPLVMVKVVNSTPEPDGSYKDYFLRVPPDMMTARAAVAWTFGLAAQDYCPAVES